MHCPMCHSDNREGVKFCEECGTKFEIVCPVCKIKIPLGKKFCGECGHKLDVTAKTQPEELSFDKKIKKIQRYLPKGLTQKVLAQRDKIEGERRQVTVMFCDMAGFTPLVEQFGAETAYDIMDRVYELLIHKVHDYGGTVNEMTGDGVVALFGAPIALEDAPQRAIRSAHAIHRKMLKLSDKLKKEMDIKPIRMRVGIHTGPVVMGSLGNDLRVEFKAVGDTVNLASRIEHLTVPGSTYVSGDTFKLTEGFFRFESLGRKTIKGKEATVAVYRVIGPSTRRTRFDVSAERGLTSFVGREREIELLLDGLERVKTGQGQVFSIVAEAGVGKSRLLYEFRKSVTNENVTFLEGKSLSYSREVAYHPIIDILKSNFNIHEKDEDSEIRGKIQKGLKAIGGYDEYSLPYLLELLSVKNSGIDISQSPESRKEHIKSALRRIVLKGSESRPMIIVFEDLHWVDNSSEDSLKDLMDSIAGENVFLIITYRPEFEPTWSGKSYHNQITLSRLSNRESLSIVAHLLDNDIIDKNIEALILEKTEGVPFFIEEFVRSLKDLKIIEKKERRYHLTDDIQPVTIPSTIQDMIMARVDVLPEGAKDVLQLGSVIEREFSYELIKRVSSFSEKDLLSHLFALKDAELLYERGIFPESTYIFKHALTREIVYGSILKKKKKKIHEEIGRAIEEVYKDNIEEHYGIAAAHFIEGENYNKGAIYSEMAAKKANKAASSNEAFKHSINRIFCIEKLQPSKLKDKQIIDARTALAAYYINYAHIAEAHEVVSPITELTNKINYQKKLPIIYTALGVYAIAYEENSSKALNYLNKVLEISKVTRNPISTYLTLWNLGMHFSWQCEFSKGENYFKNCYEMSNAAKNSLGMSASKSVLSMWTYLHQGKIGLAETALKEALDISRKSGDIYAKGLAHCGYGNLLYLKGSLDASEDYLQKGYEFLKKTNQIIFFAWAAGCLGQLYLETGDFVKSQYYYNQVQSFLKDNKSFFPSLINKFTVSIAKTKLLSEGADINLPDLFRCYKHNSVKIFKGWMARDIAEILLSINTDHPGEAEEWIKKAIEADKQNGMKWQLACDFAVYADFYKFKSDRTNAKEYISNAIRLFRECGADSWAEKFEKRWNEY